MTKEEHLLTILSEECSEVHQRCSKALRFGLYEVELGRFDTNKERIVQELNDLFAVVEMVFGKPIDYFIRLDDMEAKKEKVEKFLKYSADCGTLNT